MSDYTSKLRILLSKKIRQNQPHILSNCDKEKISSTLSALLDFCSKKLGKTLSIVKVEYIIDNEDDFLIKFSADNKNVYFNTSIFERCTLEFYLFIMVHEAIHGILQGLPNKKEVKKLTDYFNFWMPIVDVSADANVAEFMHKKYNYSCKKYFEVYSTGIDAFKDTEIRPHKLQRFISSSLTIYNYFHNERNEIFYISDKPPSVVTTEIFMLPVIHITNSGLCGVKWLSISQKNYSELTCLYTNEKMLSPKTYSKRIINVCKEIFTASEDKKEIPINITFTM